MRIIVLSDTHGRIKGFERLWQLHRGADLFIHLGDGVAEVDLMRTEHSETAFVGVRGNCDFGSEESDEKLMELEGVRIFFTHGHRYGVKAGIESLVEAARQRDADVLLFGHTHQSFCQYTDGLYIMNPGSLERPRTGRGGYGVVDIENGAPVVFVRELP